MKTTKRLSGVVLAGVLSLSLLTPVMAQVGGGGGYNGGGGGFGRGGGGFQIDPSQLRNLILNPIRDQVGFNDDEWSVIGEKIWKVILLQADNGPNGLNNLAGGGGGGGGGRRRFAAMITQALNNGKPTDATARATELQTALDDPTTPAEQISFKLTAYREAIRKVREQLLLAQNDLRSVLTVRQEAILMSDGLLD